MRVWILLLVLNLIALGNIFAQSPERWPEPPRQHAKWEPDEAVPVRLRSAAETIFKQGFPDPRDCEYREIEIEVSGVWSHESSLVKTHGWVLPEHSGARCAIAWNGTIYPIKTLGTAADLQNDLASLRRLAPRPFPTARPFDTAISETRSVFATNSTSSRVLLLLRLGETAVALKNWAPDQQTMIQLQPEVFQSGTNPSDAYDPYLELAGDWAWGLFDQILSAHMRGDETLALASARQLAEAQPDIEAEAARRGYRRPQSYSSQISKPTVLPYLNFLEQFPEILRDLERRAHEAPRFSVTESELKKTTNQAERIQLLIHDLDLVQARQNGQPGGVNPSDDFMVAALISEGDAAVEPLLHCLETDQRLTRSVSFHRDFFRRRHVLPVSVVAESALETILQTGFTGGAPEIRAYWKRYGNLKLEDRWYEMLKDDSAGMERWKEAAANIVRSENIAAYQNGSTRRMPTPTNDPVHLRGEVLRAKSNPSVSELLARRATQVSDSRPESYQLSTACEIALALVDWDLRAAAPVSQALVSRCRAVMEYSTKASSWPTQRLGVFIAKLTDARIRGGDNQAFNDYTDWLKLMTPEQLDSYLGDSLAPLGEFATNVLMQAAAETLFVPTNSPWSHLPWTQSGFFDPVKSKLVDLPGFRSLIFRELQNTQIVGSVEWNPPQTLGFQLTNRFHMGGSRQSSLPETNRPNGHAQTELRWCDWIALSLSEQKRIPPFNPFAPVDQRDLALAEAREKLVAP
jgi:hypothetical protein